MKRFLAKLRRLAGKVGGWILRPWSTPIIGGLWRPLTSIPVLGLVFKVWYYAFHLPVHAIALTVKVADDVLPEIEVRPQVSELTSEEKGQLALTSNTETDSEGHLSTAIDPDGQLSEIPTPER